MSRRKTGNPTIRIRWMLVVVVALFGLCAGQAVMVQAVDPTGAAKKAAKQLMVARDVPASRGTITDRNGTILAFSEPSVTIYADPILIANNGYTDARQMDAEDRLEAAAAPGQLAAILATHLGGAPEDYLARLTRTTTHYSVIARLIPSSTFLEIKDDMTEQDLFGLYREQTMRRVYPNDTLAANILGFVDTDSLGIAGFEYAYNSTLQGTPGREEYETSPNGRIPLGATTLVEAVNGNDYQLTIDADMQWVAQKVLASQVRETSAVSGTAIVMNVKTGEILAMATSPTFNANEAGDAAEADRGNRPVSSTYEPGSIQKILTFAALVDQGLVDPDDVVTVAGTIPSGGAVVKDAWTHGTETVRARWVFANSSNVGTIMFARKGSAAKLNEYLRLFGLGQKTGLGLPGEASGSLLGDDMSQGSYEQISFGQGLSVTAIQEATAVAGVVNDGLYNKPRIIASITAADGRVERTTVTGTRRVVSAETSVKIRDMMESIFQTYTSSRYQLTNYRAGAKSGTAQFFDTSCHCYRGYVASYLGVAPIENPEILTYVVLDRPKGSAFFGSDVAGPAWHDIMTQVLPMAGILPSTTKSPERSMTP